MAHCRWVLVASIVAFITGCRGPRPAFTPATTPLVDLKGQLLLVDGTPVPDAELAVTCGKTARTVRTDQRGQFTVTAVPEGTCRITTTTATADNEAALDEQVRVSSNVLRGIAGLRLTLPPAHRVALEVRSTDGNSRTVILDQSIDPAPALLAGKRWGRLRPGRKLRRGTVRVTSVTSRPWMPLEYRGEPRGQEVFDLPLVTPDRARLAHLSPATRQLVVLQGCDTDVTTMLDALEGVASTYRVTGLTVSVVVTGPHCVGQGRPLVPIYLGGKEIRWALQANPGDLLVLDSGGHVLLRRRIGKGMVNLTSAIDDAVAFLDRSWPVFGAVRRVSLNLAPSVKAAETDRLVSLATRHLKARRYEEAHLALDRVLEIAPDLAEAHEQRALVKARLGDVTGAMQEVSWWRSSFGGESADDLLDKVQQACSQQLEPM